LRKPKHHPGRRAAYDPTMPATAARVARNEAIFAEANDRIATVAGTMPPIDFVPFLCECPDAACAEIAELSLGEYAALRLYANRFAISCRCRSGDRALTAVVERNERFTIVDRLA
jgi:hypothetical protein